MSEPLVSRINQNFHHLRYVVIAAGGLAMGFMMFLRLSISVTMVSMVNHTQIFLNEHQNSTHEEVDRFFDPGYIEMGEFDWSNEVQEKIITFYMITYTIFPFFTTRLIMRVGLSIGVAVSLAICAITNILTPVLAYQGWQWVLVLRLVNGCAASGIVPGMVNLIHSWTPKRENARGVVIYQFTGNILAVITPLVGGMLAAIHWKWAYYVPGYTVLVFSLLWWVFVSDSPFTSRLISQQELDLLKEDSTTCAIDVKEDKSAKQEVSHWQIFKFREFYGMATIWCLYCATSGGFTFLLPSYLHRVLQIPVDQIGMLTFISQLGSLFSMLWPNQVADFAMRRFGISLTSARQLIVFICEYTKISQLSQLFMIDLALTETNLLGVLMASVTLMYLAYEHSYLVALVCVHRFFHMTHDTVFLATVMSQFGPSGLSGLVYSVFNSLGCINSTIFCVLVGKFLDYTGETLECWSWVFVAITLMNVMYLFIYCALCHSNPVQLGKIKQDQEAASVH